METLTSKTPEELNAILQELIFEVRPVFGDKLGKIILFGSYARGDYDAESDIDIMFIVEAAADEIRGFNHKLSPILGPLGLKHDVIISDFVQDNHTFQQYLPVLPFYQHVAEEGVVLYE